MTDAVRRRIQRNAALNWGLLALLPWGALLVLQTGAALGHWVDGIVEGFAEQRSNAEPPILVHQASETQQYRLVPLEAVARESHAFEPVTANSIGAMTEAIRRDGRFVPLGESHFASIELIGHDDRTLMLLTDHRIPWPGSGEGRGTVSHATLYDLSEDGRPTLYWHCRLQETRVEWLPLADGSLALGTDVELAGLRPWVLMGGTVRRVWRLDTQLLQRHWDQERQYLLVVLLSSLLPTLWLLVWGHRFSGPWPPFAPFRWETARSRWVSLILIPALCLPFNVLATLVLWLAPLAALGVSTHRRRGGLRQTAFG